eukprot:SAG22_NODE_468_length_10147_cov_77.238654_9_plen_970_part_00
MGLPSFETSVADAGGLADGHPITLFMMPPITVTGDDESSTQLYRSACESRGLLGVAEACCHPATQLTSEIAPFGGLVLPQGFGMDDLHRATGWTSLIFFESDVSHDYIVGIDGSANRIFGGSDNLATRTMSVSPVCGIVPEAEGRRLLSLPIKSDDHAADPQTDSSHFAASTDFSDPQQLKALFGAVVMKLNKVENDNVALQKRTQVLEVENQAVRAELEQVIRDKAALENKTRGVEAELSTMLIAVAQLQNRTHTNSVRLDQCEADVHPFIHEMQASQRRRLQDEETLCRGSGLTAMFAACCPAGSGGGHRRFLQHAQGCDVLPDTCPTACAPLFIDFYEGCQDMVGDLTAEERQQFAGLYADCNEMAQQQAAVADGAKPALMFHMVVIDQEAEQQAAMANSGSGPSPPFGPVVLPPAGPPASGGAGSGTPGAVQEFQRVCSRANLTVCAPQCNPVTEGYLLSVLIEGRGTLMTCNQEDDVYSWQGQSALGSCITKRGPTWLENIMTHAAGTFALELVASVAVVIAADLVAGQSALLHGIAEGEPPWWTFLGEGPAFIVGAGAELEISAVTVAATSGLAFRVSGSSTVVLSTLRLQKGDGSTDAISCAALATGVGQAGLTREDTGFGGVNVAGPLFISTSGAGFGMGGTKYMGDDRGVFEEAVSTREPGLYTCQISHDEIVTLMLPVESAMHVSIVGDDSMPQWSFTGEGLAFTVAVHAYLNLAYVNVPAGQISLMRGGEFSLDHVQMQGTQIHVAGSLAASNSQLTDVQFETEPAAVMAIDSTSISGTGEEALALPIGCSTTINGGEIRNAELQVTSDGELIVTGTAMYVEGMAVSVATGASFTVSTSQLIHGEITDPFPCNGANMACTGLHAGSVVVAGPASINTAAPLVCADESAGSCLSGYVDMPSCLADIERGMESCFVYLQRDTGELGTISVDAREHFEIHGNQGEPKLRLLADFGVNGFWF